MSLVRKAEADIRNESYQAVQTGYRGLPGL